MNYYTDIAKHIHIIPVSILCQLNHKRVLQHVCHKPTWVSSHFLWVFCIRFLVKNENVEYLSVHPQSIHPQMSIIYNDIYPFSSLYVTSYIVDDIPAETFFILSFWCWLMDGPGLKWYKETEDISYRLSIVHIIYTQIYLLMSWWKF